MHILVTGNNGYIGTVLTKVLVQKGYTVTGLDINYFLSCTIEPDQREFRQIAKDIREVDNSDLAGIDAVIHLAGLSNDPLGEFDPRLTKEINFNGTLKLAKLAKESGVSRFVYASSQSMYGISDTENELDEEDSKKNPVTAYARTKWEAELDLKMMDNDDFVVVCGFGQDLGVVGGGAREVIVQVRVRVEQDSSKFNGTLYHAPP